MIIDLVDTGIVEYIINSTFVFIFFYINYLKSAMKI